MIRTRTLAVFLALIAVGGVAAQVAAVPGVTAQQQDGADGQGAEFSVDSLAAPESVAPGATVTVVAEVTNTGDQRGSQSVDFRVDGDVVDRQFVTLEAGETRLVRFSADTEDLDTGDVRHGVFTESDGIIADLVISESFTIEDFDAPETVESGETVTIDVELENPNDFSTTQTVQFRFAGQTVESRQVTVEDDPEDVTFNVSTEGIPTGTFVHGVFTRDEGEFAEITIEEPGPDNATVSMSDQESDGTTVTIDQLTLPEDGYVVIHDDSLLDGNVVGSVVGVSEFLEAGEYENVTVTLFEVPGAEFNETTLTEDQTLVAMPHNETTGDETYDFVTSDGADDGPFLVDGEAVTDAANVTVAGADENATEAPDENATEASDENATEASDENATEAPDENATEAPDENATEETTAGVTLDDQESDGTNVVVTDVSLSEGGYVVIHDSSLLEGNVVGSVVGVSEYLEPGEYDEVTVELFDVPGVGFEEPTLTEDQTLVAMPHLETTGDETYDFVTSAGDDDGPYVADGQPVTDAGNVTVANETAG